MDTNHPLHGRNPIHPGLVFALIIMAFLLVWFAPRPGEDVAVLASPWRPRSESGLIAARAGASLIGTSRWTNLIVVKNSDRDTVIRLYKAGAWLVFNPNAVVGCFDRSNAQ